MKGCLITIIWGALLAVSCGGEDKTSDDGREERSAEPKSEPEMAPVEPKTEEPVVGKEAESPPEPAVEESRRVTLRDIDLVVIPGTGFDVKGNRLGYGGGYYDRLLSYEATQMSRAEHIPTVALAFEEQIGDEIPAEPHDIKVDIIITDKRIIRCT